MTADEASRPEIREVYILGCKAQTVDWDTHLKLRRQAFHLLLVELDTPLDEAVELVRAAFSPDDGGRY